jgi:hypothetical protein
MVCSVAQGHEVAVGGTTDSAEGASELGIRRGESPNSHSLKIAERSKNARHETRHLPRICSANVGHEIAVGGITESITENIEPAIVARSNTTTVVDSLSVNPQFLPMVCAVVEGHEVAVDGTAESAEGVIEPGTRRGESQSSHSRKIAERKPWQSPLVNSVVVGHEIAASAEGALSSASVVVKAHTATVEKSLSVVESLGMKRGNFAEIAPPK